MKVSTLTQILEDFNSLFFPRYCLACYDGLVKGEEVVCTSCRLAMPQTEHHLDFENSLKRRLAARVNISYAMALFHFTKSGMVQELLHNLKYRSCPEVGVFLGKMHGDKLAQTNYHSIWNLIIPIPLHSSRLRKRGYNQSAKFAEGLSDKLHIPVVEDVVVRNTRTETQTRKSKLNRWENVEAVFDVAKPDVLFDQRVLLVDDVVTTGATVEACAHSLLKNRCRDVSVVCIAEA